MKNICAMLLVFVPAILFAGELNVSVFDKELEIPLEGVEISVKSHPSVRAQTDENGTAVLALPDAVSSGAVEAFLPGYQTASVSFSASDRAVQISLAIVDVIEGQTLVVNRASPEETEEKTGVVSVMTKEEMHSTANIGIMEDCMSAVRTLLGVSYSGAWGTEPSIRGAEPREFSSFLTECTRFFRGTGAAVSQFSILRW